MPRTKAEIIARMNEIGHTTRFCNGSCPAKRKSYAGEIDEEKRKVPFVMISANNAGKRYDWWNDEIYIEELDVNGADFSRLATFFKDHSLKVDNAIGRVENVRIENGELRSDVIFGTDEDAEKIYRKYVDGILSDVSIGYIVRDVVITEKKDEPTHVLVTDYEIRELSAVWAGFDAGAGRANATDQQTRTIPQNRDPKILLQKLQIKEIEQ